MLNPDERIDHGFAVLKQAQPSFQPNDLVVKARRQAFRTKLGRMVGGSAAGLVVAGLFALTIQPTSALAALKESARLTASQPVIHVQAERTDALQAQSKSPWLPQPKRDIWRFQDRYVCKQGHLLSVKYRNGRSLDFDDRFEVGVESSYDAKKDPIWSFDGSISIYLQQMHKTQPTVQNVVRQGLGLTKYEWHELNPIGNQTTAQVFVDPDSKLVRFSDQTDISPSGESTHWTAKLEYPSLSDAEQETPRSPAAINFRPQNGLIEEFNRTLSEPDQSKTLAGVETTLYGVVIYPNRPDGLGVDIITKASSGEAYGVAHHPEIIGSPMLPTKRADWFKHEEDMPQAKFGTFRMIAGSKYFVNRSNDLLVSAPKTITVRVPVWRSGNSSEADFVGWVTFTTSKIFATPGNDEWSLYINPSNRN